MNRIGGYMEYKKTYINGCWVDGNSDKELKAVNPSNGEVIAVIKENNLDDVKSAVASAKNAFYVTRQWRDMSAQERADILLKIADEVEKQAEEIAKNRVYGQWQAFERAEADVDDAVHCFRYYAGLIRTPTGGVYEVNSNFGRMHSYSVTEPVGRMCFNNTLEFPFPYGAFGS